MPPLYGDMDMLISEIKTLPKCRAMQNGTVYHGRIVPQDALLTIGVVPHPVMLQLGYPARQLFFLMDEQNAEARAQLTHAIIEASGVPEFAQNSFTVSIVPESDLMW